jgi:pimeloyl-ACP methyl ester carboxylesterase
MTYQRARWMRDAIAPSFTEAGIASALLKYRVQGWNARDDEPSPLADARWALDELAAHYDVPVVLVGHSMGGRTGIRVAQHPNVVGLVAVAPWFPADEEVSPLAGRHLSVLHGTRDRITSAQESRAVADRSESVTASTTYQALPDRGHYLLKDASGWHRGIRREVQRIIEANQSASMQQGVKG